ncbi:hypothetical protein GCM10022280_08860 [Sphingomonas swuensis]|uniref:Uncharacterized protein n=1 Tax=Sphingomonas swuensis TaxID=977800 RepID=A0ABP7SKR0_9SPHN
MIYHLSIAAHDPRRVAAVLAELWRGEVHPFPPIASGSLVVLAGDDRNSLIEVYPHGTELVPAEGDADCISTHNPEASSRSATHAAIATPLSRAEVMEIAAREGWIAKYRKRGGAFGVIELWLENSCMMELLTTDMAGEYLDTMTPAGWRQALEAAAPRA